jgi:branched-chain amino acid transport system permease protein
MALLTIQILNILFYAAVLFLISAGLSLIYGVMGIVNFAHGALFALGAYVTAWVAASLFGSTLVGTLGSAAALIIVPLGALGVAAVGAVIEPVLLRPLYRRSEEYHLLLTFGLFMVIEDLIRLVFGGAPLPGDGMVAGLSSFPVGRFRYPSYNLFVIAVGALAVFLLWALVKKTRFGIMLRAVSQNRRMAAALGVDVSGFYVRAFALGCFMAGLGGALIVPTQAAGLGMGMDALLLAFVVVVIGGLGSLEGALFGAIVVSVVRTMAIQYFPEVELAALYLSAIAVLLVRPTGLFGGAGQ